VITPNISEYVLVRGRTGTLPQIVTDRLQNGWQLLGQPFRTGNRIRFLPEGCSGHGDWLYTNEIAQAMVRSAIDVLPPPLTVSDEGVPPIVVELDDKDQSKQQFAYVRPMFRRGRWYRRGRSQS
jgi:hypothetical protein